MSRLQGRVLDYDTDKPLQGVYVGLMDKTGKVVKVAGTNAEGAYSIDDPVVDDTYAKVKFSLRDYRAEEMRVASANNQDVILMKEGTDTAAIVIARDYKSWIIAIVVIVLLVILYYAFLKGKIK
jgi:5-hydroxyisourate hydrolase-like protein (transthyretin family)